MIFKCSVRVSFLWLTVLSLLLNKRASRIAYLRQRLSTIYIQINTQAFSADQQRYYAHIHTHVKADSKRALLLTCINLYVCLGVS